MSVFKEVHDLTIQYLDNPGEDRKQLCFSTQSGCAMGCAFCVTGKLGLVRNLESAEMPWQLALVRTHEPFVALNRRAAPLDPLV